MHTAILVAFSFVFVIFLGCAAAVWNMEKTPDRGMVFGVTLSPAAQEDPEVKRVRARFGKLCFKWGIVLALTFLPVPVLLEAVPNLATKKGRAFYYGTLSFAVVLVVGISVSLLISDFSVPVLRIDDAVHTVSIDTAFYGTEFSESSVRAVTLVNSVPKSFRTNGSDDGYSAVGHFTVEGYGPSLLYIHRNKPPYLLIQLPDK